MKWLIFAAAISGILAEWYGKDYLRKNRFFPQRRKNNLIYLLCSMFFGVLLFRCSRLTYYTFPYHIVNLFGWFFLTAGIIRLFSVIWERLFEREWLEKEFDPRSQIMCSSIRMGVGLLIWFLIFSTFGKGDAIQFPVGEGVFLGSGIIAVTGILSWIWTDPHFPVWKNQRIQRISRYLYVGLNPVFMILLCETAQGSVFSDFNLKALVVDLILCVLGEIVLICIVPARGRIFCCVILQLIALLIGMVDQFLITIREMPFMANDIYSISTAATVAERYSYPLTIGILEGIVIFQALWIVADFSQTEYVVNKVSSYRNAVGTDSWKKTFRLVSRFLVSGLAFCTIALWVSFISFQENYTGEMNLFRPAITYRSCGFLSSFIVSWQALQIEKPAGYSVRRVEELLSSAGKEITTEKTATTAVQPSIIVIMNEAFSDQSVLAPMDCTKEDLKFYNSLKDDPGTLQFGYDFVSTYGGGTAMTEWEYLTSMSNYFIPGRIAYTQMNLSDVPSLPVVLKEQGYRTIAIHPYQGANYRRNTVYKTLGFDSFLTEEDFEGMDTIRDYCTDRSDYERLLEEWEKSSEPAFIFNITMQNHGGYVLDSSMDEYLTTVDPQLEEYEDFVVYESLLRQSDEALEYLVNYLKECSRPVILCFFGDHQPSLTEFRDVMREAGRTEDDTELDMIEKECAVSYLIWANYDVNVSIPKITYRDQDITSPGMMGIMTTLYAGVEQTPYMSWIYSTREKIPAMNCNGYFAGDGLWHSHTEETPYFDTVRELSYVQYNALIDRKNRLSQYYRLDSAVE